MYMSFIDAAFSPKLVRVPRAHGAPRATTAPDRIADTRSSVTLTDGQHAPFIHTTLEL